MDLDGTLLPHEGGIPARVKAAVRRAHDHGILVTLASGRTFASTARFAAELGIRLPLISHQGALVKDPHSGRILHEDLIPIDIMREVISFARRNNLHLNVYVDDRTYMERSGRELELYTKLSRTAQAPIPDLLRVLDRRPTKCIFVSENGAKTEALLPVLQEAFRELRIVRSHPLLIEGVMPTVSKGRALAVLAADQGISQQETVAIGDSENDIEMLQWAALGLAMGQSPPGVLAAADHVLPSVEDDGAAYGIEHYVLNRKHADGPA